MSNDGAGLHPIGFHAYLELFLLILLGVLVESLDDTHAHHRVNQPRRSFIRHIGLGYDTPKNCLGLLEPASVEIKFVALVLTFQQQILMVIFATNAKVSMLRAVWHGDPLVVED